MVELRWAVIPGWDGPEKVLQYRQLVDNTAYALSMWGPDSLKKMEMSDWKTVPVVDLTQSDV